MKTETLWFIAHPTFGLYYGGGGPTRKDAIRKHCESRQMLWEVCRKEFGHRAIKCTVTPVERKS